MEENLKQSVKNLNTKDINLNKVNLEDQAIDKEAYHMWNKMIKLPQLTDKKDFQASDGRIVKLGTPISTMMKMIEGLPQEEIDTILKKKQLYTTLMMKANNLKIRAFGLSRVPKGSPAMINKIFESRRLEIIELFGRMFSVQEVHKICVEDWEIHVGIESVAKFRAEHTDLIEEKIKNHKTSFSDIRLGVKRSRLEELCWIYSQSKDKYNKMGSREDLKVMITVLDKIKDETEGQNLNINVSGQVDVEITVNQHVQREVMKGLGLRQLIIGRVASKMKTSPTIIIDRLTQSYYSKFATMDDSEVEDIEYSEVKYPTKEPYDFDKIKSMNQAIVNQTNRIIESERVQQYQNTEAVKKIGAKEALLSMIKGEKDKVAAVRSQADAMELNRDIQETAKLSTMEKLKSLMKGK